MGKGGPVSMVTTLNHKINRKYIYINNLSLKWTIYSLPNPKMYFSMRPTWTKIMVDLGHGQGHAIQGQRMKNGLKMNSYFLANALFSLNMYT